MTMLVTKLPDAVNNDDLLRLGEMVIDISEASATASENQIYLERYNTDLSIRVGNDGYLYDDAVHTPPGVKTDTFTSGSKTYYYDNDVRKLFFSPKANLKCISFAIGDISQAMFNRNKRINIGNISQYKNSALSTLYLYGAQWEGSVADLMKLSTLRYLRFSTDKVADASDLAYNTNLQGLQIMYSTNITGNVSELGSLTKLTNLVLSGSGVDGTAADIKAAMEAAGRTSGTLNFTDKNYTQSTIIFGT